MYLFEKKLISIGFVLLLIGICLAISYFYAGGMPSVFSEGFEVINTDSYITMPEDNTSNNRYTYMYENGKDEDKKVDTNPGTGNYFETADSKFSKYPYGPNVTDLPKTYIENDYSTIPDGYYVVLMKKKDGTEITGMAKVPYGYYRISATKYSKLPIGTQVGELPYNNGPIPQGYYVSNVDVNQTNPDGTIKYGDDGKTPLTTSMRKLIKVPSGYEADLTKTSISPIKKTSAYALLQSGNAPNEMSSDTTKTDDKVYNPLNTDVVYHTDELSSGKDDSQTCTMVKDPEGKMVCLENQLGSTLPTYYQPGSFIFSSSNFVPNYEDSVYLSLSTGMSTVGKAYPTTSSLGGFCKSLINSPTELEQKCLATDASTCASTSCCVLLGGAKCVAGDASGPKMKSNYSDRTLANKDFYYFNGQCYGNCM